MLFNQPEGIEKTPEQHSSELEVERPIRIYNESVRGTIDTTANRVGGMALPHRKIAEDFEIDVDKLCEGRNWVNWAGESFYQ